MKITGWRALLASGALMFGTAAFAQSGSQGSTTDPSQSQSQSEQQPIGGSGSEQGDVQQDDRPFEEPGTGGSGMEQGSIEMESESVEGTGGSGQQQTQPAEPQTQPPPQQPMGQPTGQMDQGQQQGSLNGQVVQSKKDMVFLKLDQGAIVPVKVSEQTTAQHQGKELRGQKALEKVKPGDQLSIQVEQRNNENHASSIEFSDQGQQQPQELEGRVASVQGNWINLEHQGALIPLKADNQTQFQSQGDQQVQRASDLKEGDEIRASFEAKGNINNAKSIEVTSATGGASDQGLEQPQQRPIGEPLPYEEPAPPPTEDPATGGSSDQGFEQQPPPTEEPLPTEEPGTGGSFEEGTQEPIQQDDSMQQDSQGSQLP